MMLTLFELYPAGIVKSPARPRVATGEVGSRIVIRGEINANDASH